MNPFDSMQNASRDSADPVSPRHASMGDLPWALASLDAILAVAAASPARGRLAIFLDYDGTLTPIAERPELARLSAKTRAALRRLQARLPVALVSGRGLEELRTLVGLPDLLYAGDHGFAIEGAGGRKLEIAEVADLPPRLDRIQWDLEREIGAIAGIRLERKTYSIAVHYRLVADEAAVERLRDSVQEKLRSQPGLRLTRGKKVLELQPDIEWDKGKAVLWILDRLKQEGEECFPLYIGDDVTDEDAFQALLGRGIGVVVEGGEHPTFADYRLKDCAEVRAFLEALIEKLPEKAAR